MDTVQVLSLCGGFVLGAVVVLLWHRGRVRDARSGLERELAAAQAEAATQRGMVERTEGRIAELEAAKDALDRELAVARERVTQTAAAMEQQRVFLAESRKEMEDAFRSLAAGALRGNTEQFLQLAEQRWATTREQASKDLEERKQAIEHLLSPLRDTLGKLEARTGEMEKDRQGAYEVLRRQLADLHESTRKLDDKTLELTTALRGSNQVRGRWGEIALRNVVELAGMTEHCDFAEQEQVEGGGRPDMIVRLPGNRMIAVDAKVPLSGYLEAHEAVTDEAREAALDRHVAALRGHVRALSGREYAEGLDGGTDFVVLFLPGDPFLAAAFARDPELQVDALRARVLVATPTTLVALLRTVAIYWQQQSLAENAELIAATARELYERAALFGEHLGRVGKGLRDAVDHYNSAVASFDSRFVPMGRKLEELRITKQARRALESPGVVEQTPRPPSGEQLGVEFDTQVPR